LFLWLRLCMMRSAWRALLSSPLKLVVIVATWSVLILGAYLIAHRGLMFVHETAGVGPFLLDRLWYLFLFIVFLMLAVSQLATAYSTLVCSPETAGWMSLPVSARWILRAKWCESSCYSAWAVLLLVIPLGLAYLRILEKPPWLVVWLLGTLLPLVGIATSLSTLVLLVWLRWIGRLPIRRELIPVGFVTVCVVLFWVFGERRQPQQQDVWFVALQELLPRMQLASSTWLPSSWMARALGDGVNQRWMDALVFCALLWTTCALTVRVLDHVASSVLLPVLRRSHHLAGAAFSSPSLQPKRKFKSAGERDRLGHSQVVGWMRRPLVACMAKDVVLLLRDPAQWSQGLVFFGLLGAYFANIHRIRWMSVEPSWRIGIASLNLACTLLVFGSLAVRFVFPQVSLEGRRLWLIHIVPGGLRRLLYSKLLLYGVVGAAIVEGLSWLTVTRLQLPLPIGWWFAGVGLVASMSLVGLTVGLGAWLVDPNASDPARIVSSSSGALALVLMLLYVGGVAWGLVIAWTSWIQRQSGGLIFATLAILAVSVMLGYLPVRRGLRVLDRLEL